LSNQLQAKSLELFSANKAKDEFILKLNEKDIKLEYLQNQLNFLEDEKLNNIIQTNKI
jgi:hypothetical protein